MIVKYFKIILVFQLLIIDSSNSQWQTVNTGFNFNYHDVSVVNENIIWAEGTKIVRTTNGGLNWFDSNPNNPGFFVTKISAVSDLKAWISDDDLVYGTTNGGLNWIEQNYTPKKYINNIYFFNQNTGILLADPSGGITGFFITRNGGTNWYRSANSPPNTEWLIDNCLFAYDTSFICFADFTNGQGYKLYKLSGGLDAVWLIYDLTITFSFSPIITFKNYNDGLLTDGLKLYKTTNGGVNWNSFSDSILGSYTAHDILNVRNTNWVIVNNSPRVRISYDWGNTWQQLVVNQESIFGLMDSYDTNSIWIAGKNGVNYKYNFDYIGIKNETEIVNDFKLHQNYPNPFNPVTTIVFEIPKTSTVSLTIFDNLGRIVEAPVENVRLNPGKYEYEWKADKLASGIYYCRMTSEEYSKTIKTILIK
jgi:photosystem II stability/assembly factor-like uncharacterized protein